MGQTLTHGVYLPDEGERNCYNGLAANWQLLDNSVGTIAEHTSALAGKAPLVHTHTKADITDFPVYGTTAGTICEGNDSRLSDARTPVAHTHTKTDIIDLFNSANTWTAKNYFPLTGFYLRGFSSSASVPASNEFSQYSMVDVNNSPLMSINSANRTTSVRDLTFRVYAYDGSANGVGVFKDAANNYSFCSMDLNNTIELGTSTNKWKTLNGINPGALSLPVTALNDTYDISGNITNLTGGNNTFFAPRTGWVFIRSTNATSLIIVNNVTGMGSSDHSNSATILAVSMPVTFGESINIIAKCTSLSHAYLLPCQGNV